MSNAQREKWRKLVDRNIARHGHHITLIGNEVSPRYAYTVGLTPKVGYELVFAGGLYYSADEIADVVNGVAAQLTPADSKGRTRKLDVGALGTFTLGAVRKEWRKDMLGAIERYGDRGARQVLPDKAHWTLDTPEMSKPRSAAVNRAWTWERKKWPHEESWGAMTSLEVLRGAPITEVARWEDDYWEMFAGEDPSAMDRADARYVSMAILVALDPTLLRSLDLAVGEGMRRDGRRRAWKPWRSGGP